MMRFKQIVAAVLCAASLGTAILPVSAAQVPTQKSGKTDDGVNYTLYYPKVYGVVNATIDVLNEGWGGDGVCHTVNVELPVVASGDPFVLKLNSGITGSRCPDCGTSCIHVFFGDYLYEINGDDATRADTFEWRGHGPVIPGKTANTIEIDYKADSVGLRELNELSMDPSDHFFYTPDHPYYDPDGRNYADGVFPLNVGYYLRLPKETIEKMDFAKTYDAKGLAALLQGETNAAVTGTPSSWAAAEIQKATDAGLIPQLTGTPGYQDQITREQFAELVATLVLVGLNDICDANLPSDFTDCDNPLVAYAAQCGIVTGVGNGRFNPTGTTNREQIATMVARAVAYLEQRKSVDLTPNEGSVSAYTDGASVSTWAAEGVGLLVANGIMNGTSATTLSPRNTCTVEQSILLCWRVFEQLGAQ